MRPPVRQRYRPTCVISWSRHGYEKASYCISTTGRQPAMQRPIALPRIPASASGVSTQRSGPKRSRSPAVARNTPPARPTSSPSTITSESRSNSQCSASLTASTSVSSAIAHVPGRVDIGVREHELWIRRRRCLGGGDARAHQVLRLLARFRRSLFVQHAELLQDILVPREAFVRTFFFDAREVDVRARIVRRRVRRSAVVHAFDERRTAARARALDSFPRGVV